MGVIGAGICGATAASALAAAGWRVTAFDKGRGPGGRMSTRRGESASFDHGAQYFTARDDGFREQVRNWVAAGVVARWDASLVTIDDAGCRPCPEDERFVGVPAMSRIVAASCEGLDVRFGEAVLAVERDTSGWRVATGSGEHGPYDLLIVTTPPAQAAALLEKSGTPLLNTIRSVRMLPTWALMFTLGPAASARFDGAFIRNGSALSWIVRNASKPGRDEGGAWVAHASHAWSMANLERSGDEVARELAGVAAEVLGVAPGAVVSADAHRWRYASVENPPGVPWLEDTEGRLLIAGDWLMGSRVESAWSSGAAAARAALAAPRAVTLRR